MKSLLTFFLTACLLLTVATVFAQVSGKIQNKPAVTPDIKKLPIAEKVIVNTLQIVPYGPTGKCTYTLTIGGLTVVNSHGACFGPNPNPTINDPHSISSIAAANGSQYTVELPKLKPACEYNLRSYAITASGLVFYSESKSFTVLAPDTK